MPDELNRIKTLVAEEQEIRRKGSHDRARLHEIEVQLDQCWDLLRQRNARREFGQDDDFVAPRDPPTVEGYLQ